MEVTLGMQSTGDPIPSVPLPPIGYHARSPLSKPGRAGRSVGSSPAH